MAMTCRIECEWTLRAPLSHIGESTGVDSYLVTQDIIGPDGLPTEVFVYSGNALRGMWRDAGAQYLLDTLGGEERIQVPLSLFYLLWSGGSIGGQQTVDIDQARRLRRALPHVSLFGGGVGSQILPGKLNVSDAYLCCAETQHLIPERLRSPQARSWRQMTTERSYTRTDDAKHEGRRAYLRDAALPGPVLPPPALEGRTRKTAKGAPREAPPQQMRYTLEVVQAGARLWSDVLLFDAEPLELGAFVACLDQWGQRPVLGGKSAVGLGRVDLTATLVATDGTVQPFTRIADGRRDHAPPAVEAKALYDAFLAEYRQYLMTHREGLVALLDH
jgi:hypothetical protein